MELLEAVRVLKASDGSGRAAKDAAEARPFFFAIERVAAGAAALEEVLAGRRGLRGHWPGGEDADGGDDREYGESQPSHDLSPPASCESTKARLCLPAT